MGRHCGRAGPKLLAEFTKFQRAVLGWKQETFASFAGVSLSTIERVERGEKVRNESLDKIAETIGYKPCEDCGTTPHILYTALSDEVTSFNFGAR